MSVRQGTVSTEVLRDAAKQRVETSTLRQVADAIGMSSSGLFSFLQGGDPYPKTYRKLLAWYVRERRDYHWPEVDANTVRISLELLTLHLPASRRRTVQQKILELLGEDMAALAGSLPATKSSRPKARQRR